MWVCYSPRVSQETEADEIPRVSPRSPSSPPARGQHHVLHWEGELCLPGVTQDVSGSFQETPLSLWPCTVQHTPVTHPRYPEGCWVVSTSGLWGKMLWTLFIVLYEAIFLRKPNLKNDQNTFHQSVLSVPHSVCICVSTRIHSRKHVRISAGGTPRTHHWIITRIHTVQSRHDWKQATGL